MKFQITRTSIHQEEQPCEEAKPEKVPESISKYNTTDIMWVIEINTIEELVQLSKKYGDLIVTETSRFKELLPSIEIYDEHRE